MKRKNVRRSSAIKKIAKTDVVPNAVDKFRNGLSSPEEFSTKDAINHVEFEKMKIIEEFMPLIMKSTVKEAYDMVLELEEGIQQVIQDFLKAKAPQDELQGHGQRLGSDMEAESVEVRTVVKTEIDDMTITHEWTSTASQEREDNVEDGICIAHVRGLENEKQRTPETSVIKDFGDGAQATEHRREQTKALLSRMMDFAFKEFKSSLSLEKFFLPDLDPSVKLEMVNQFLEKEVTVDFFHSSVDAHQCKERLSSLEEIPESPGPEIATASESTTNVLDAPSAKSSEVKEKTKFKKLESSLLPILEAIRYPNSGDEERTTYPVPGVSFSYFADVSVGDLLSVIKEMKRLLKKYKTWSNSEYRQIHARLVRAVRIAGKVVSNGQLSYEPWYSRKTTKQNTSIPPLLYLDKADCILWCMYLDVDIRECLPSQRCSPEFQKDRHSAEDMFLLALNNFELIKDFVVRGFSRNGQYLGQQLMTLDILQAASKETKTRRSSDLCMEALYYFWKLRAEKDHLPWVEKDLDDDSEAESDNGSKAHSEYDSDSE